MFCSSKTGAKLTVEGGWPLYKYFQAHPSEVAGERDTPTKIDDMAGLPGLRHTALRAFSAGCLIKDMHCRCRLPCPGRHLINFWPQQRRRGAQDHGKQRHSQRQPVQHCQRGYSAPVRVQDVVSLVFRPALPEQPRYAQCNAWKLRALEAQAPEML